jgi:hypothetical protein
MGVAMKNEIKRVAVFVMIAFAFNTSAVLAADGVEPKTFSTYVDKTGKIRVPENYRTEWDFLGSWSIAADEKGGGGAAEFHNVYTQPTTIEAFRKTGKFPDGAVLVKELLMTRTDRLTTGKASWGTDEKGWFVMIKDTKDRFPKNGLWGDGWGWALFNADDPLNTVTEDYTTDCLPCHVPVKDNDWIYTYGYPTLRNHKPGE